MDGQAVLEVLGALGFASVGVLLAVLGLLSRRLGSATQTPPHYRWFFVAAVFVGLGVVARLAYIGRRPPELNLMHPEVLWAVVYNGLPALGVTLGLTVAWRYWSWLLAERD